MFEGKMKAVTFSYDDGVTQDLRIISMFEKYGLRGTFNLNSGLLGNKDTLTRCSVTVSHEKIPANEIRRVYSGHEVAVHTLTHPKLTLIEDDSLIIRQVEEDRLRLSELCGYEVVGMAYPGGNPNHDDRVVDLIKNHTGIKYARVYDSNFSFDIQADLFRFHSTCQDINHYAKMLELAEEFVEMKPDKPQIFYIWGHSYTYDIWPEKWKLFDRFLSTIAGKNDIFYGTNSEVLLRAQKINKD